MVTYDQYVSDCLRHLKDQTVYWNLTEAEAVAAVQLLKTKIFGWLEVYEDLFIDDNAHKYILNHMAANYLSLFGQFYILYKIHKG